MCRDLQSGAVVSGWCGVDGRGRGMSVCGRLTECGSITRCCRAATYSKRCLLEHCPAWTSQCHLNLSVSPLSLSFCVCE